jgi:ATP-binding cassette subfamily B multidrug efflux pump
VLLRLLRVRLRPYRRETLILIVLQVVGTVASLYLPRLNAAIIDRGLATGDTGFIVGTGGVMLLVTALQIVCQGGAVFYGAGVSMRVGRDLRAAIFHRVGELSGREVSRFGVASLIVRNTNDVQQVQLLVTLTGTMFIGAPITCVGGVAMALREDSGLSWLVLVSVPVLAAAIGTIAALLVPRFRLLQERIDRINRVLREQITGVRVVRAFGREQDEAARFERANADMCAVAIQAGRLLALVMPTVMLVLNASCVGVLWFGAARVADGTIEIGSLTAFLSYLLQILMSVMLATFVLMTVPRASVGADRIMAVLDTETSVPVAEHPVTTLPGAAEPQLRDVEFRYPGAAEPVLRDISFRARAGRTTAVVGGIGSGKSTLLSLIARLFDATGGQVLVGGRDVRDIEPDVLWSRIALVPSKAYLFSGTVAGNLRYGRPDATDDELWAALEIAQARDFVAALPDGLYAPVLQGGTNLSGGQRQRLAIARAVVKRAEIYLLDDCFSALDAVTSARLRAALEQVTANAAFVVVTQRVSTVIDADQILVLDEGRLVGAGTHAELLRDCSVYAEIVESQRMAEAAL